MSSSRSHSRSQSDQTIPSSPSSDHSVSLNSAHSNFVSFLECITPHVSSGMLPTSACTHKPVGSWKPSSEMVSDHSFSLKDFWQCFSEWSAFGAPVPIALDEDNTSLQYYSPSLSAIQIYTPKAFATSSRGELFKKKTANPENIGSSIEEEGAKLSKSLSNSSSMTSASTSDDLPAAYTVELLGDLYFQYNEILSPYDRVPLMQKIKQLAKAYPGLLELKNSEITPYSWVAVAWYPIYQIPSAKNVKELSACFITYHGLTSTCYPGPTHSKQEKDDASKPTDSFEEDLKGKDLKEEGSTEDDEDEECEEQEVKRVVAFPPFATATYKLFGRLWINPATSDGLRIAAQENAAFSWLRQLRFNHSDFNFFMSHKSFYNN